METSARTDRALLITVVAVALVLFVLVAFHLAAGPSPAGAIGDSDHGGTGTRTSSSTTLPDDTTTSSPTTSQPSSTTTTQAPASTSVPSSEPTAGATISAGCEFVFVTFLTDDWDARPIPALVDIDGDPVFTSPDIAAFSPEQTSPFFMLEPGDHWVVVHMRGQQVAAATVTTESCDETPPADPDVCQTAEDPDACDPDFTG